MIRVISWVAPILLALMVASCSNNDVAWKGSDIRGVMPDLSFELISESGLDVNQETFLGKATLMFFGFTNCPDICPGTLQGLASAIEALPEERQDEVQVLFVSVDPSRDTPDRLKAYTDFFGPQVTGLTGTDDQLSALVKRMRATYGYGEADENGNYAVSHSSAIYGFNADGEAQVLLRGNQPISDLTHDIQLLLQAS